MHKRKRDRLSTRTLLEVIFDWLQMPESFHFDTDLPLEDCVTRLKTLARTPGLLDMNPEHRTVEITRESATDYRFIIVHDLSRQVVNRIRIDGTLREDEGITFVDGFTGSGSSTDVSLMMLTITIGTVVLLTALIWHIVPALIILVFAALFTGVLRMSYLEERTYLIHRIYDTLDHEQVIAPDALADEYTIMKQKHSGR